MGAGMNIRDARKGGRIESNGEVWQAWYNATGTAIADGTLVYRKVNGAAANPEEMTPYELAADDGTAPRLEEYGVVDSNHQTTPADGTQEGGSIPTAEYGWVKTKGVVDLTTLASITPTITHGIKGHNRALDTTGAVPAQTTTVDLGLWITGGASVTHEVYLFGIPGRTTTT